MSVKKVEETRRDRGARRREERREEAGSYACSAPPTLSETQDSTCPPSSRRTATRKSGSWLLGCCPDSIRLSIRCAPCMPREVLDVGRFSEWTNAISNESKVFWNFGRRSKSTGSGTYRFIIEVRDCTLLMEERRTLEM